MKCLYSVNWIWMKSLSNSLLETGENWRNASAIHAQTHTNTAFLSPASLKDPDASCTSHFLDEHQEKYKKKKSAFLL